MYDLSRHSRTRRDTDNMSNPRLSVALENGRYAKVQTWQKEPRLDLREWEISEVTGKHDMKPTKKGISLKLHQIKSLSDKMDFIDESLDKLKKEPGIWVTMFMFPYKKIIHVWTSASIGDHLTKMRSFRQRKDFVCDPQNTVISRNSGKILNRVYRSWRPSFSALIKTII